MPDPRRLVISPRLAARYALLAALALAPLAAAPQAPDPKRTVAEQKLKLLDAVLNSPKMKQAAAGTDTEAKAQADKARQLADTAREALAAGEVEQAGAALDQAMRAVSAASAARGSASLSVSAERTRNAELAEQIRSYRASLSEVQKTNAAAKPVIERIDKLSGEAEKLAAGGQYGEANKLLAEAYTAAITAISSLRAGQTVTLSLKFDTPADEYAYEIKRFESHEMLVEMMIGEGRAEGDKRLLVDRYTGEGRKLRTQAEGEAKGGDHPVAIKTMEQATGLLIRALVTMGVPIF